MNEYEDYITGYELVVKRDLQGLKDMVADGKSLFGNDGKLLGVACNNCDHEIVEYLLTLSDHTSGKLWDSHFAMLQAASCNSNTPYVMGLLLGSGIRKGIGDGTCMHIAMANTQCSVFKLLVDSALSTGPADLNKIYSDRGMKILSSFVPKPLMGDTFNWLSYMVRQRSDKDNYHKIFGSKLCTLLLGDWNGVTPVINGSDSYDIDFIGWLLDIAIKPDKVVVGKLNAIETAFGSTKGLLPSEYVGYSASNMFNMWIDDLYSEWTPDKRMVATEQIDANYLVFVITNAMKEYMSRTEKELLGENGRFSKFLEEEVERAVWYLRRNLNKSTDYFELADAKNKLYPRIALDSLLANPGLMRPIISVINSDMRLMGFSGKKIA